MTRASLTAKIGVAAPRKAMMAITAAVTVFAINTGARAQVTSVQITPSQVTPAPQLPTDAATPSTPTPAMPTPDNAILLTVFFRHDQTRPLGELNAQLERQGFYKAFPPPGVEVVSWYVMMGIGQVVTLRLPASRLREVNRALETTAWGSYHTEFYPTYDYAPTGLASHQKAQAQ